MELRVESEERHVKAIAGADLPRIDVVENVMARIIGKGKEREKRSRRKPTLALAGLAALLVASGFGYAAESFKLFSPSGSVTMEVQSFPPGDEPFAGYDHEELLKEIPVGEAALFYWRESGTFISLENNRFYDSLGELQREAGRMVPPETIGEDFQFVRGKISHELNLDEVTAGMEELPKSMREGGVEYAYTPIGVSEQVAGVYAVYRNEAGSELSLNQWAGEQWKKMYADLEGRELEKVTLTSGEALYMKDTAEGSHKLVWMQGGEREEGESSSVQITLQALLSSDITKESLVEAADGVARRLQVLSE